MATHSKNFQTPRGQLIWNYIFEADDEDTTYVAKNGKKKTIKADGKRKVTLRLYGDDAQSLIKDIDALKEWAADDQEVDTDEVTSMPYRQAKDKNKDNIDGCFDFVFKTKEQKAVVDVKKNRVLQKHIPGYTKGGILGEGVVGYKPHCFTVSGNTGIGLYLQGVMLMKINDGAGFDFDLIEDIDDDGFVVDSTEDYTPATEDNDDDIPDFAS